MEAKENTGEEERVQLNLWLPKPLVEAIRELARREGRLVSAQAERMFAEWFHLEDQAK